MQRRLTVSLVAFQCVVACGYAVQAHEAPEPSARADAHTIRTTATEASTPVATVPVKPEKAPDGLTLRLTPRFANAPGYLRSIVRVVPNADNRILRLEIDSAGYYRSSDIQLDGDAAPESHFVDWKAVPAGQYELTVSVIGSTGTRAVRHLPFQVFGLYDQN